MKGINFGHSNGQNQNSNPPKPPLTFYRYPPKNTIKLEEFYELGAIRLLCMYLAIE
jgi:hypothetical protein